MTHHQKCPFCDIVEGVDQYVREIYRDDQAVAFFPTEPAVLGHTLIIPRRHVPFVWDLNGEEAGYLGQLCARLSRVLIETIGSEGLNIIQSNGEVATQTVEHVHFHLVPRGEDDAIGKIWPHETAYAEEAKERVHIRVREACKVIEL